MVISELKLPEVKEQEVDLKSLASLHGTCFRWANVSYDEAMSSDPPAFFKVVPKVPGKEGENTNDRVPIMPIDGKSGIILRDGDRKVIVHQVEYFVARNILASKPKKKKT